MTIKSAIGALLAASLVVTGCQKAEEPAPAPAYPSGPITMTAGANPGSGFDITIRAVVDALEKENIVDVPLPVENRPGNIGADFLATMVEQYRGRDDQVSVTSLSMMMNELRGISEYGYGDVTMIARLITEYYVVVTDSGSRYQTLADVMTAIKADPGVVEVAAATDDQAPFDLLVAAAGGDPAKLNYVPFEGGGDQTQALLNSDISVAIGGVSEFVQLVKSGELRALGVLSEERLPGFDAPTAREQGFDVTLSNWRGLYGPPAMPDFAVKYWQDALATMVDTPTWKQIAERNQFTTTFMVGDEFQSFLAETQADLKAALAS
ncbi:tripartite tricarboxylate transporter substrate binding protein [Mycobacterium sp. 236(2023)]|uniref:tripartite tricarboxylate transporter substrate binding protein n=1 Tax=Mycobacterium sp. 236(2023) TaxID=3038163 RepID=UPI002415321F|nr:tripartite tricarboxylate transporter substrate binding protein [Mycobacterium sp. 236(2023)]MDG4667520.1 tripartite tricarboxylate transporter substrate binding protein [Mycobacterium sp. 236(2023)]